MTNSKEIGPSQSLRHIPAPHHENQQEHVRFPKVCKAAWLKVVSRCCDTLSSLRNALSLAKSRSANKYLRKTLPLQTPPTPTPTTSTTTPSTAPSSRLLCFSSYTYILCNLQIDTHRPLHRQQLLPITTPSCSCGNAVCIFYPAYQSPY